jgi:hypothetical protein
LIRSVLGVVRDKATGAPSLFYWSIRSRTPLIEEDLFIRKQLAFYQKRQMPGFHDFF